MELQCSISQQERVAQLLMEVFGSKLFVSTDANKYRILPSPNDLRGKIIIKVKC
jgi:phosphatidylinositol phospholipase C delta